MSLVVLLRTIDSFHHVAGGLCTARNDSTQISSTFSQSVITKDISQNKNTTIHKIVVIASAQHSDQLIMYFLSHTIAPFLSFLH